jgi:uncharacterized protein YeaO (DUF488 family)
MALFTKSVQDKAKKTDGIRVCIMRRPDAWVKYDVWMPVLAPSGKLLDDYHNKKVTWLQFEKRFAKEVTQAHPEYIEVLCAMAQKQDVTILCWEETPDMCHRRLVAQACKKMHPRLSVTHL